MYDGGGKKGFFCITSKNESLSRLSLEDSCESSSSSTASQSMSEKRWDAERSVDVSTKKERERNLGRITRRPNLTFILSSPRTMASPSMSDFTVSLTPNPVQEHLRLGQHCFLTPGTSAPGRICSGGRETGISGRGPAFQDSCHSTGTQGVPRPSFLTSRS